MKDISAKTARIKTTIGRINTQKQRLF